MAYWARKYPVHATILGTQFAWMLGLLVAAEVARQLGITIGVWVVWAATALPVGVRRIVRRLKAHDLV